MGILTSHTGEDKPTNKKMFRGSRVKGLFWESISAGNPGPHACYLEIQWHPVAHLEVNWLVLGLRHPSNIREPTAIHPKASKEVNSGSAARKFDPGKDLAYFEAIENRFQYISMRSCAPCPPAPCCWEDVSLSTSRGPRFQDSQPRLDIVARTSKTQSSLNARDAVGCSITSGQSLHMIWTWQNLSRCGSPGDLCSSWPPNKGLKAKMARLQQWPYGRVWLAAAFWCFLNPLGISGHTARNLRACTLAASSFSSFQIANFFRVTDWTSRVSLAAVCHGIPFCRFEITIVTYTDWLNDWMPPLVTRSLLKPTPAEHIICQ